MSPFQALTKFSPPSPPGSTCRVSSLICCIQEFFQELPGLPLDLDGWGRCVCFHWPLSYSQLARQGHLLVADKPIAKSQKRVPSNNELILISRYQIGCNCKNALSLNLHETVRTFFLPRHLLTICKHSPSSILTASIKNLFVFSMSSPQAAELHQTGRKCLERLSKLL